VSVEEMKAIDAAAARTTPLDALVERAGAAVARAGLRMLGGAYGRRVVVVAGKGHNGDDGRVAARRLGARGARVAVLDAADGLSIGPCDLVVDAAYGTGFRGTYVAPALAPSTPVLAVDIPSGVNGDTGVAAPGAATADATVTFAALKPGLLLREGPVRSGRVIVADIGLDVSRARQHLVEDGDAVLPARPRDAHKWQAAVRVVAGSPGMMGAARLTALSALRAGSGMVRLGVPGATPADLPVGEMVSSTLPAEGWDEAVLADLHRFSALVLGPGLGRSPATSAAVRRLVGDAPVPVVVDADALNVLGEAASVSSLTAKRTEAVVLTPHDGEFARLAGSGPPPDRLAGARDLAAGTGAVVLSKGPTTIVADPGGDTLLVTSGSPRLATPGTGDVLSGMVGAFVARGLPPLRAAAFAAHVHGRAAGLGPSDGLVAGDLLDLVPRWLSGHRRGFGARRRSRPDALRRRRPSSAGRRRG
jgi:ADP-dependent NAD(P)H-hydrate dehydratase / NAD(P)H-hydrate epimerase